MTAYLVEFSDKSYVCALADSDKHAKDQIAELIPNKEIVAVGHLPYPCSPIVTENPHGELPFCYRPKSCVGRSSCPHSYACSE